MISGEVSEAGTVGAVVLATTRAVDAEVGEGEEREEFFLFPFFFFRRDNVGSRHSEVAWREVGPW